LVLVLSQGGYGDDEVYAVSYRPASGPTFPVRVELGGEASRLILGAFDRAPDDSHFFASPEVDA